jgi:hypothetical protein
MDIRVILIAPSFKNTVPRMAGKLGYATELIQIRRYGLEGEEFLLVEFLEPETPPKPGVTKVKEEWDWDFYAREHGQEAARQFRKTVEAIDAFVHKQGWDVRYNLNKYYTGFKLGNRIVFDVIWGGSYVWKVEMKLPKERGEAFQGEHWEFQRYDADFHNVVFRPLRPEAPNIKELEPLLIEAYKNIAGLK